MREIIFILFVILTISSAAITALGKNLIHSVFALMATFFGIAGLYVFLMADFIAIAQIMVYVGGILVLLIFGVMLTQKVHTMVIIHGTVNRLAAAILGIILLILLSYSIGQTTWFSAQVAAPADIAVNSIGELLMTKYLLAFELVSVLLLGALIGAATIARGESK